MIAIIPARGGSKGLPGKNIKDLLNKPLIAYTIEAAQKSKYISRIIVSTDCEKIAETAIKYGAEVPFLRSKKYDTNIFCGVSGFNSIQHKLKFMHVPIEKETTKNHKRNDVTQRNEKCFSPPDVTQRNETIFVKNMTHSASIHRERLFYLLSFQTL